jgi:hypothetical protein
VQRDDHGAGFSGSRGNRYDRILVIRNRERPEIGACVEGSECGSWWRGRRGGWSLVGLRELTRDRVFLRPLDRSGGRRLFGQRGTGRLLPARRGARCEQHQDPRAQPSPDSRKREHFRRRL